MDSLITFFKKKNLIQSFHNTQMLGMKHYSFPLFRSGSYEFTTQLPAFIRVYHFVYFDSAWLRYKKLKIYIYLIKKIKKEI